MSKLTDRISYLQGLAEGMKLNPDKDSHRLIIEILDVLGEVGDSFEALAEDHRELREYVAKLFMWTTPKYTGISMEPVNPDDNSLPVITEQVLMPEKNTTIQPPADSSESLMPEGWTGKYILTNLPDTTVITGYEVGSISVVCYRINPSSPGWDISYNEYPGQEYVYIDTEDAVFSTHVINGWTATAAVKDDLVSLWWNDEDTMFVLQGQHMDLSEVKNYAQHIVPVN